MMFNFNQNTLLEPISFSGVGLHTGKLAKVNIYPAEANSGIVFKRIDIKDKNLIKANFKNVSSAKLCTTLTNQFGVSVSTVEHLMAAFYISGVDNAIVEIDQEEIPIMDGSSKDFVKMIKTQGLNKQSQKRKIIKILKKVELEKDGKKISIEPDHSGLSVNFKLNFQNKLIGNQSNEIKFYEKSLEEVYSSRTFCLFEDIENIKKNGLAKGGSLENAVVVKGEKVLNEGGLRNKKEFVNHKILDLAGDFLLSGYRIFGQVKCSEGGHQLSNLFLNKIFSDYSNFDEVDLGNLNQANQKFKLPENKIAVNA